MKNTRQSKKPQGQRSGTTGQRGENAGQRGVSAGQRDASAGTRGASGQTGARDYRGAGAGSRGAGAETGARDYRGAGAGQRGAKAETGARDYRSADAEQRGASAQTGAKDYRSAESKRGRGAKPGAKGRNVGSEQSGVNPETGAKEYRSTGAGQYGVGAQAGKVRKESKAKIKQRGKKALTELNDYRFTGVGKLGANFLAAAQEKRDAAALKRGGKTQKGAKNRQSTGSEQSGVNAETGAKEYRSVSPEQRGANAQTGAKDRRSTRTEQSGVNAATGAKEYRGASAGQRGGNTEQAAKMNDIGSNKRKSSAPKPKPSGGSRSALSPDKKAEQRGDGQSFAGKSGASRPAEGNRPTEAKRPNTGRNENASGPKAKNIKANRGNKPASINTTSPTDTYGSATGKIPTSSRANNNEAVEPKNLPVSKNEDYIAEIVGIGHEGEGVGRVNGYTLFIPGALPGERVRTRVIKVKKQYGYGKLLEILEKSPDRLKAPCPIYDQCGGCQLQHLGYDAQLRHKQQLVVDALERIGKLQVRTSAEELDASAEAGELNADVKAGDSNLSVNAGKSNVNVKAGETNADVTAGGSTEGIMAGESTESVNVGESNADVKTVESTEGVKAVDSNDGLKARESNDSVNKGILVHPVIGMPNPWQYRNKAQVPIGEVEGGLVGGFYAQGSHRIIDMDTCLIQHESNDSAVRTVKVIARKLGISAYSEETNEGLLRHVVVKIGFRTGDMMVVLVVNGKKLPEQANLISEIRSALPDVKSICLNFNTQQTNVIFGDRTEVIWGSDVIYDFIGDVKFAISARSFYQVNPVQTEVLYRTALDYAGLTGGETVIDAYCGIGTISLFLARHAGHVHGVEIVAEAIADARRNAELNDLHNVSFAVGKAEEVIPAWQAEGVAPDVIVVDPPRKGCEPELLETMLAMRPARIVYVSCNPATLARDLRVLEDGGYRAVEVQPVDMFPHTVHVESVALLVKG